MDSPRDEFFAGPRFARDKNRFSMNSVPSTLREMIAPRWVTPADGASLFPSFTGTTTTTIAEGEEAASRSSVAENSTAKFVPLFGCANS